MKYTKFLQNTKTVLTKQNNTSKILDSCYITHNSSCKKQNNLFLNTKGVSTNLIFSYIIKIISNRIQNSITKQKTVLRKYKTLLTKYETALIKPNSSYKTKIIFAKHSIFHTKSQMLLQT